MESVAVKAEKRSETRSKGASAVRAAGRIPAVLYGGDNVESISVEFNDVRHAIYTPAFKLVDLEIDGETVQCIVKDVQFHPVTEDIVHIDFLRLIEGRPVKVDVPVRFEGAAPGLRAGGKLVQKMRRIRIKTTPENLVDELVVDISDLKLGFSVRVRDAQVSDEIEVMNPGATPVASIEVPRALRSAGAAGDGDADVDGDEEGGEEGAEEAQD